MIQAAANVAWALPGTSLAFTAPECNSFGLALMDSPALEARSKPRLTPSSFLKTTFTSGSPPGLWIRFWRAFSTW